MKQQAITAVAVLDEMIEEANNPWKEWESKHKTSALKEAKSRIQAIDVWIAVTDRKPPHLKESKFWTDYGEIVGKRVIEYKNGWVDGEHYIDKNGKYFTPSHWQPLQLPPKQ